MLRAGSILFSLAVVLSSAQNCRPTGQWCGDVEECCGGCCINNVCVDITDENCSMLTDPCLDHYCPAGSECRLYQPDCAGCEMQMECHFKPSKLNSTLHH